MAAISCMPSSHSTGCYWTSKAIHKDTSLAETWGSQDDSIHLYGMKMIVKLMYIIKCPPSIHWFIGCSLLFVEITWDICTFKVGIMPVFRGWFGGWFRGNQWHHVTSYAATPKVQDLGVFPYFQGGSLARLGDTIIRKYRWNSWNFMCICLTSNEILMSDILLRNIFTCSSRSVAVLNFKCLILILQCTNKGKASSGMQARAFPSPSGFSKSRAWSDLFSPKNQHVTMSMAPLESRFGAFSL